MKKYILNKNSNTNFYISIINDDILIITDGVESPFDYLNVLLKRLQTISKKIKKDKIKIYFDFLSCSGNRSNRFGTIQYDKKSNNLDIFTFKNISKDDLPKSIHEAINKYQNNNLHNIIENSVLTKTEKDRLLLSHP